MSGGIVSFGFVPFFVVRAIIRMFTGKSSATMIPRNCARFFPALTCEMRTTCEVRTHNRSINPNQHQLAFAVFKQPVIKACGPLSHCKTRTPRGMEKAKNKKVARIIAPQGLDLFFSVTGIERSQ
jgi:hypothetical protein